MNIESIKNEFKNRVCEQVDRKRQSNDMVDRVGVCGG